MDTIIIAVLTIVGYITVSFLTSYGYDIVTTILITSLAEGIAMATILTAMLWIRKNRSRNLER